MAELKNCMLPDDLQYHVEYNVWLRANDDGSWDLGMTDIAQTLAGSILHCRPKKVGKAIKAGRGVATVESGKWVGPVRTPFACKVLARNDAAESDPPVLNRSPYKDGWIVRVEPIDAGTVADSLVSGEEAVAGFSAYMAEKDLGECIHCEGFDG